MHSGVIGNQPGSTGRFAKFLGEGLEMMFVSGFGCRMRECVGRVPRGRAVAAVRTIDQIRPCFPYRSSSELACSSQKLPDVGPAHQLMTCGGNQRNDKAC
jgi:hypothetical protein